MKPLYALFALLLLTSCDVGTVFRRMLDDDDLKPIPFIDQ